MVSYNREAASQEKSSSDFCLINRLVCMPGLFIKTTSSSLADVSLLPTAYVSEEHRY